MTVPNSVISHTDFNIQGVFEFDFINQTFNLSFMFQQDIIKSEYPILITVFGNSRVGKSLRLNQILTRTIYPSGPFLSRGGLKPITTNLQYQSISLLELTTVHDLQYNSPNHAPAETPTVFLIDCPSLSIIFGKSPLLRKAFFTLTQFVHINIFVITESIKKTNTEYFQTSFNSQKINTNFSGFNFQPINIICIRDRGIPFNLEFTDILSLNLMRKKNDEIETARAIKHFQDLNLQFTNDKLFVISQPNILNKELYSKTIEDIIETIISVSQVSEHFRGSLIVEYFDVIAKKNLSICELEQIQSKFPKIMGKIINQHSVNNPSGYIKNVVQVKWVKDLIPSQIQIYENELKEEIKTKLSLIKILDVLQFNFFNYTNEIEDKLTMKITQDLKHLDSNIQNSAEIQQLIKISHSKLSSFISRKSEIMKNEYQLLQKPENKQITTTFDEESQKPKQQNTQVENDTLPITLIRHPRKKYLARQNVTKQDKDIGPKKLTKLQKKTKVFWKTLTRTETQN
jgi:hypothetical protein